MQTEFGKLDLFDPAQLNMLILQSTLTYQFLKELEVKKLSKPETAFGYMAEQNLQAKYGQESIRNVPVFPFTASLLTPEDGLILNIQHEEDLEAYH